MLKSLINFIITTFGFGNILQTIIYNFTIFVTSSKDLELVLGNDRIAFLIRFIIFYQNLGMIISAMTFISWTVKKDPFFKMVSVQMVYNFILFTLISYLFFNTSQGVKNPEILTKNQKRLITECIFVSGMHVVAATIILYFKREIAHLFFNEEKEQVDYLFKNLVLCTHLVSRDDMCTICLEDKYNTIVGVLQCSHTFHSQCILDWIKIESRCPLCREPIE